MAATLPLTLAFSTLYSAPVFAQATAAGSGSSGGSPSFKLSGNAELTTNFVLRGLTETDKDPALQGSFWFNFGPQFRLGIWGSNVGYKGSDSRFWLKYNGDIAVPFSQNTKLVISASKNNFYKEDERNGWTYGLRLSIFNYKIIFENETNWEGTGTGMNYLALGYTYSISDRWKWVSQFGYSKLNVDSLASYFDLRTGAHYTTAQNLTYKIDITGTSNNGQIGNGRANYFIILGAQVEY